MFRLARLGLRLTPGAEGGSAEENQELFSELEEGEGSTLRNESRKHARSLGSLWANIQVSTGLHSSWSLWGGLLSQPFVVSVWPHFLAQSPLYSSSSENSAFPSVLPHSHFPLTGAGKDDTFLRIAGLKMCKAGLTWLIHNI